jgi:hypothetical protein
LLTKEELILIIKDMYDDTIDEHYNLQNVAINDLLEIIGDNSHILSYCIDNYNAHETALENQFTKDVVQQTLKELGIQRHLLSKKPILERNNSDYKTYLNLLKKSGRSWVRYAIVSKEIADENLEVFADQVVLYNTEQEARKALFNLQIEQNQDIE